MHSNGSIRSSNKAEIQYIAQNPFLCLSQDRIEIQEGFLLDFIEKVKGVYNLVGPEISLKLKDAKK